jgi:hypothetical protein
MVKTLVIVICLLLTMLFSLSCDGKSQETTTPATTTPVKTIETFYTHGPNVGASPTVASTPVPESELTHIIFSMNWILENDVDPDPRTVKISFPEAWLTKSPTLASGEKSIELAIPTELLWHDNMSKTAGVITVTFPNSVFRGLPGTTDK